MKLLLIDNYDSFTYNLYHRLEPYATRIDVVLNDEVNLNAVTEYDGIVFSPGPGLPANAGAMMEIIRQFHNEIPMLGICLGMQAMAECFGGTLRNLDEVIHGRPQSCRIIESNDPVYKGLPETIEVGHYHSWVVDQLPGCFEITAIHEQGFPVSIRHRKSNLCGIQYHPESVLTPQGPEILRNWVQSIGTLSPQISEVLSDQK